MQMTQTEQAVFVVTGMHRSGTSFTASLLQSAGLDIGQQLIGPGHGNVRGFFESIDFVEFHQTVLHSQGINEIGWTLQEKFDVEDQYVEKAKEIIAKNLQSSVWGWKDPRTTLLLDFWLDLLPNANFLLVYRSPWEVVDSLYRRGDDIFIEHPELAVKMWMHYNQKIIEFFDKNSDRCLLTSIYSIVNQTQSFIQAINEKFKANLVAPTSDLYDQSLFHTQVSNDHRSTLIGHYFPQALDVYQELNVREVHISGAPPDLSWLKGIKSSPYRSWAFQDWVNIRDLEKQVKGLQAELERSQSQLQQAQANLETLSSSTDTELSVED